MFDGRSLRADLYTCLVLTEKQKNNCASLLANVEIKKSYMRPRSVVWLPRLLVLLLSVCAVRVVRAVGRR